MRKLILVLAAVLLWLSFPADVRADAPVYTITVTSNEPVELGCLWSEDAMEPAGHYIECESCLEAVCVLTQTLEIVGVYFSVEPGVLDTWSYTATPGSVFTATWYRERDVFWDGYVYTGTHWVTFTLSMLEPTPTPTPTPTMTPSPTPTLDPSEYSWEYRHTNLVHKQYLPLVMGGAGGSGGTTPGEGYDGDTTWWEWASEIEAFFAPVFEAIATARQDIDTLHQGTCGNPWNAFTPPLDPTSGTPELYMLEGRPTATVTAYVMGISIGRPMAWIRSIQQSNSVLGLNFFVMLIYFLSAGIGWLVFVTIVTYSARLIRYAVAALIKLYELIPFKAS